MISALGIGLGSKLPFNIRGRLCLFHIFASDDKIKQKIPNKTLAPTFSIPFRFLYNRIEAHNRKNSGSARKMNGVRERIQSSMGLRRHAKAAVIHLGREEGTYADDWTRFGRAEQAMGSLMIAFAIGLIGSLVIALLAYWRRSLSGSGAAAAVVLGTALYTLTTLAWYGTLIAFFVSSTVWSKVKRGHKAEAERHYAKGGRRDAGQVAANGGIPLLMAVGWTIFPHPAWWYAYLGALAAVTADTWATELGALSRRKPRSIITGKRVEPGTSGGITLFGLAASCAGGAFIGVTAYGLALLSGEAASSIGLSEGISMGMAVSASESTSMSMSMSTNMSTNMSMNMNINGLAGFLPGLLLLLICGLAGLIGSLFDSFLGATVQAVYRCESCRKLVERDIHCGRPAAHVRGVTWMGNDQVNAAAGICGASAAVLIAWQLVL